MEFTSKQISELLTSYLNTWPGKIHVEDYIRHSTKDHEFGIMQALAGTKEDKRIMIRLDSGQIFYITIEEQLQD